MPEEKTRITAHPDELFFKNREIEIFYALPKKGINEQTGLLGIHTGDGIDPEIAYYKKVRQWFADKYNLIVFGTRYMGIIAKKTMKLTMVENKSNRTYSDFNELLKIYKGKDLRDIFTFKQSFNENVWYNQTDYYDFGLLESLDVVYSIKFLLKKYPKLDKRKIFLFGSSHGGFISEMVCKFLPKTVKAIIDISGTINIEKSRIQNGQKTGMFLDMDNTYVSTITHTPYDPKNMDGMEVTKDMLEIRDTMNEKHIYESERFCLLLTGKDDHKISVESKETQMNRYLTKGMKGELKIIGEKEIDGILYKHAGHSLGGNVVSVFTIYLNKYLKTFMDNDGECDKGKLVYETSNGFYSITHEDFGCSLGFEWKTE